ncbi:hypothetical protein BDN71DRAFT_1392892, partial [Pleurotus eryngii]
MGRGWQWEHFYDNGSKFKTNNTHKAAWCRACVKETTNSLVAEDSAQSTRRTDAQRLKHALATLQPVCGKVSNMERHLRDCPLVPEGVKRRLKGDNGSDDEDNDASMVITLRKRKTQAKLTVVSSAPWNKTQKQEYEADLCHLFVALNLPWNAVSNPEFQSFTSKYIPSASNPDRKALSGRILDKEVALVTTLTKSVVQGKYGTGVVDGWKNIAKESLQATGFNVEGKEYPFNVHNVTAERKTSKNLLDIVKPDITTITTVYGVKLVGWCCDSGGDSRGLRRLLLAEMPWLVVLECWAHQINLVVGDYFKNAGPEVTEILNEAISVINWFTSHTRALGLLRKRQKDTIGNVLAFVRAVLTRWTTHFLSLRRLLAMSTALRTVATMDEKELLIVAGDDADLVAKAQEIIDTILSRTFWERLTAVKLYLEPLALAANITQASTTCLDQVLMTLAGLYHTYTSEPCFTERRSNDAIVDSLRKRWLKCDQDVFIVAVFLNPYIRGHFFDGSVHSLSRPGLFNVVKRVYARVFQETERQVPIQLFENYLNYFDHSSVYTDDGMNL